MLGTARRMLDEARRVVSLSGAGLSAESGIPTFREAQTGLWARHDPTRLASPEGFAANPDLVIDWYNFRRRLLAGAAPNRAHLSLAARVDLTHITQNVDNLLESAGARRVLHLHGTIDHDRCDARCGFLETVDLADPPPHRPCPRCGAPVRPAVVWFGEPLDPEVWRAAERRVDEADVLLVIGTSGVVYPAAGMIGRARRAGAAVILVNAEPIEAAVDIELIGEAGTVLPALLDP
jgi:NAD-dependent deacetylase